MNFRMISLPPLKVVTSGVNKACDFSESGVLGKFDTYFSKQVQSRRIASLQGTFLHFDEARGGMVWIYALKDINQC